MSSCHGFKFEIKGVMRVTDLPEERGDEDHVDERAGDCAAGDEPGTGIVQAETVYVNRDSDTERADDVEPEVPTYISHDIDAETQLQA